MVFLEAMFDQDKVTSTLYHFHILFISGANCKVVTAQIDGPASPRYHSELLLTMKTCTGTRMMQI